MKFIVLGDLHFTDYQSAEAIAGRDKFFDLLFQQVAAQGAELVFAVGDIVHYGYHEEIQGLYAAARRHGLELLSITGNHDTAALPKEELRPYFVGGQATGQELYHAFSQGQTRFVLLDTGREMLCDIDWSGYVSPAQQDWLAEEVAAFNNGQYGDHSLVVMGHHPFYNTTAESTVFRLNIDNSGEVRAVLGQVEPGRAIYFCGHNHINSIYGPDEMGWTHIQSGAPLVSFSFRVVTTGPAGFKVETVNFGLEDAQVKAALPALYAGLQHFADLSLEQAGGQPADREWQLNRATVSSL